MVQVQVLARSVFQVGSLRVQEHRQTPQLGEKACRRIHVNYSGCLDSEKLLQKERHSNRNSFGNLSNITSSKPAALAAKLAQAALLAKQNYIAFCYFD